MKGTSELRQSLVQWLEKNGLPALTAWPEDRRLRPQGAVAAVSLRALEGGLAGYQDYLGERFNEATGAWEELYGKRLELTIGLDLYAATAREVLDALEKLEELLRMGGPAGMSPSGFTAGETAYQSESRRYFCPVQVKFRVWAAATAREDAPFLDFEIKGENMA